MGLHRVMSLTALTMTILLAVFPAWAGMQATPVEWSMDDTIFSGMLVYDDSVAGDRPGVVMVPNWMGVTDDAVALAQQIAGTEHVVLVADVFGKGVRPADRTEARAEVGRAYADGGILLRRRVAAAVAALQAASGSASVDSHRIAAIGFCFGGSAVLELARSGARLAGVASFHGDLKTYLPTGGNLVATPLLVLNGADDTSVTPDQIVGFAREMDAAGADWQSVNYRGARHCFSQPEDAGNDPADNCLYHERSARRAFRALRDFLRERFAAA